jgi:hypothetical protein
MKNQCIKVLNEEHGKKVIEYFKSLGVDTECKGDLTGRYYGIFYEGLNFYNEPYESEVIELPIEEPEFKRGDKVLVWDNDDVISERIFLAKIEGALFPYIVKDSDKKDFLIIGYKNCKHASQVVELTLQDISDGKGVGVDPKLIKII